MDRPTDSAVESFVVKHKALLVMERESEMEQTKLLYETLSPKDLIERGLLLNKLEITEQCTGLGGKYLVTLQPIEKDSKLKRGNRFQPGDIVGFKDESTKEVVDTGVVFKVWDKGIQVALSQPNEAETFETAKYSLVHLANEVTYRRMDNALDAVSKYNPHLLGLFLGNEEQPTPSQPVPFTPVNQGLNPPQIEAISFALGSTDLALIHGPPGTGKTTTIVELIIQAVKKGLKVLACAPSNIAVDNIAERLAASRQVKMVRIGHPARFIPTVSDHSLDILVRSSNGWEVVMDLRKEMDQVHKNIQSLRGQARQKGWKDWRDLKKDLKGREWRTVEDTIKACDVVLATCTAAADKYLRKIPQFDLVVIDEAGQALEAQCWIPMLKGKRVVLAGDHLQLPPTIHSEEAAKQGLETTLFEKIIKKFGEKVAKMLVVQYRMNTKIMEWSSKAMYKNKLVAHESVKNHLLSDLANAKKSEVTDQVLVLIDTVGCNVRETQDAEGSKSNEGEAEVVVAYITQLCESGLTQDQISVISPYFAQVRLIRDLVRKKYPQIEVNTVDGFQGREKEAVIISMVRCNDKREVGFLKENRRMNVAVTRAKRQCCLICDSETVSSDKFLKKLVNYFQARGDYLSAAQFLTQTPIIGQVDTTIQPTPVPAATPPTSSEPEKSQTSDERTKALYQQLQEFKDGKNSEINVLKYDRPLSKAHAKFIENTVREMQMYSHTFMEKGHTYIDVYRTKPTEAEHEVEKDEDSEDEQKGSEDNATDTPAGDNSKKKRKRKKKPQKKQNESPSLPPAPSKPQAVIERDAKLKEMGEEEMLEFLIQTRNNCFFPGCKRSAHTVPVPCKFCKEKYCYDHMLPEVHGCKEQARAQALKDFKEQQERGNERKLHNYQRKYLEKELHKKINDTSQQRTRKPKEPEEKKDQGRRLGGGGRGGRGGGRGRSGGAV